MWIPKLCLFAAAAGLLACTEQPETAAVQVLEGPTMGTRYTVKVARPPEGFEPEKVAREIDALLLSVNAAMSTYDPNSELSRFNASESTEWEQVSPELVFVVEEALRIGGVTAGALDVTVGPLVNLWGFGAEPADREIPNEASLEEARGRVGLRHLNVRSDPPALRKTLPNLYVDLSAIAKGYAVDRIADYLSTQGAESFMVEVGGEVRVKGTNERGVGWRIGIETPSPGGRVVQRVLQPGEMALATSGDYRNFFEADGKRYSHMLDPVNGRPVEHDLASVTVIHPSAMSADGLATALMVMGTEAGLDFAAERGLAVFTISKGASGFEESHSPGFEQYLQQEETAP